MAEFNRPGSTPVQPPRPGFGQGQSSGQGQGQGGSTLSDVAGQVKDRASEFASSASQMAGQAGQQVRQWASTAADRAEDAWDDVTAWVRRNPVPTLLIVAGIGLVFALAFTATSYARSDERRW